MIKRENEVNRNIDTETAEGHRVVRGKALIGESEDPGKKTASVRRASGPDALDDVAEGHVRRLS